MNAEPGKQYIAIMHYWLWQPSMIESQGIGLRLKQEECRKSTRMFNSTTANSCGRVVTDLGEIAEFAIRLANGMESIDPELRIRLEVFELSSTPILVTS